MYGSGKDAQRAFIELAVEVDREEYEGTSATLKQLVHQWIEKGKVDHSPTAVKNYRQTIKRNILPSLGKRPLKDVTSLKFDCF